MITIGDVRDFGASWFDAVASGASAAEQAQFFLDPHARIYVVWNGVTISLEDHEKLHAKWINEPTSATAQGESGEIVAPLREARGSARRAGRARAPFGAR
jgi:hypothetical protein